MNIKNKLQIIQRLTGSSQEKLAARLGVSFPTLNSWINGKSKPRKNAEEKIELLYLWLTGRNIITPDQLQKKKQLIASQRKSCSDPLRLLRTRQDLYDQFLLSFTYNTNRLEGSTLTEPETAALLFQNVSLPDKSLTEQMEVKNHQAAFHHLIHHLNKNQDLSEEYILKLHGILMNGINTDAGRYRRHGVRIVGSRVPTANYLKVPQLMEELAVMIAADTGDILEKAVTVHARFEQIHPFSDGNGRVGRLLMAAMLLRNGIAPAIVEEKKKRYYLMYLAQAQAEQDPSRLEDFILDGIQDGYALLKSGD